MYDRPMDWSEQADKKKKKMAAYEGEKDNTFCKAQLKKIPEIGTPTSGKKRKSKLALLRRHKVNEERFLVFASKCHPEHPTYAEYIKNQKLKKQKQGEKNKFNSPSPKTRKTLKTKMYLLSPTD
jgi:hypothetical protein